MRSWLSRIFSHIELNESSKSSRDGGSRREVEVEPEAHVVRFETPM